MHKSSTNGRMFVYAVFFVLVFNYLDYNFYKLRGIKLS